MSRNETSPVTGLALELARRMIPPESAEQTLDRIRKYLENPVVPPHLQIALALAAIYKWGDSGTSQGGIMEATETSLDEIPELLARYRDLDSRYEELNGLIDQAGERAEPGMAAERRQNRAEVEEIRAKIENSDWPPTAPLRGQ